MPRGSGIVIETDVFKTIKEKLIKKEGEETLTLWTPGTEKKFLLQGIIISQNEVETYFKFEDEGTEIFGLFIPKLPTSGQDPFTIQFPVCYQSKLKGNKLKLNLALESKKVSLIVYGTEE